MKLMISTRMKAKKKAIEAKDKGDSAYPNNLHYLRPLLCRPS